MATGTCRCADRRGVDVRNWDNGEQGVGQEAGFPYLKWALLRGANSGSGLQAPAKHWSSAEHHRQTRAAAAASPMMMSTMPPDTNVEALRCAMAIDFKPVWGTHRETAHLSNSIQP